ncbi:MAG TPA: hypothetical protein VJ647_01230 [Chitinophagaceae bacterium]|nr:hypothetical protein [Chitinophagaceae bacterium]
MPQELTHKIFTCTEATFETAALEIFHFQYAHNPLYTTFTDTLNVDPRQVDSLLKIPFLPISFFKSHTVCSTSFLPEAIFESSGTTGTVNSRHFVKELALYRQSFLEGFRQFYGDPSDWCIIGLLPSYLERGNSSLVHMVDELVKLSGHKKSGFYLNEFEKLQQVLQELEAAQQKTLLIGVTFALLDFAELYPLPLMHTVVMETGGMKGRREEMTRQEVHEVLKRCFGLEQIHSEYGMTELLSQAYSKGEGIFSCPPWMKILVREEDDPLTLLLPQSPPAERDKILRETLRGQSRSASPQSLLTIGEDSAAGIINVIDLANIYSCSFIATDDAGKLYQDGSFEVTGRIDNSDLRGCSLMVADIKQ